ncbi:MAG: oligosaccharide flippase family protein [Sideroxydans sp.]|nr:oligosaccharide flippase family protein [Sideroxydans sp.]
MMTLLSAILSKAGGAMFTLLLVAYLGQSIGSRGSGYFYFTLALVVMLSQLLRLGLDGVLLRRASHHHSAHEHDALQRLGGDILVYLLTGGMLLLLAGSALERHAVPLLFPGESPALYRVALYSCLPFTLMWSSAALLKGIGRTALSVFIEAGSVPLLVLLLMLAQGGPAGYREAADALLQANLLAAALALALVYRYAGCRILWTGLLRRCLSLLKDAVQGVWVALSNTLIVWSPLFFLGMLATPADVGIYNAAFRVTMVVGAFSAVFRGIATPRLAGLLHRSESPVPYLKRAMSPIVVAGLLLLLVGELGFDWVFSQVGSGFETAATLAMLMLIGMLANVLFVMMETQLILADRNDLLRSNALFTAQFALPLTLLLIANFQAYGAALAFVLTNMLSRGNMLYLFNRQYDCRI